jgi:energy-coupling factor transporter ATP-binding protein EcfA2
MKVSIRNLGVIKEEATLDLKPLTVLIGPNNEGKTWLAYSLAGILSPFGSSQYIQAYADKKVPNTYEPLDNTIEQVLTEGNATIDLRKFADEYGEKYFNDVAQYARNWMGRFLSTQRISFADMGISLDLGATKAGFLHQITQYARTSRLARSILTIRKNQGEDKLFAFTATEIQGADGQEERLAEKIPLVEVRERLLSFVSTALRISLYPQVYTFPTERTSLITAHFGVDKEAIWPVFTFVHMLNSIFENSSFNDEVRKKNPATQRYIQLAEILEEQILAGNVYLSTPEPDPNREVLFQPAKGINLEIPIASSMVKELSSLALYLRYLAKPGELLVIDEPEMHLHPAAQVKIIEFLAMLVNTGLHVLITTHSSYVVDHLVNLMEAYKHQNQDEIIEMFLLEQKEAFIDQEKVSVYLVEDGKVKNVLSPEGAIDWGTFSEVSRLVGRIHFDLLEE